MFTKILIPTDLSLASDELIRYARELKAIGTEEVLLVHVQDSSKIHPHLEDQLEKFNQTDKERLEQIKHRLCNLGSSSVTFSIPYGIPIFCLLNEVKEISPTLIIMGSRGRSWANELFIGSVSHNIARLSDAPILLIPFKKENRQN
jgi:nucleotide-binding universal stress UspA family protein